MIYDIIYECEKQNLDGLIILIDFEKAFDLISWSFILKSIEKFDFGKNTIKWVRSLQTDSNSKFFKMVTSRKKLHWGGDAGRAIQYRPTCLFWQRNFLVKAIRKNTNIKGITIHNKEHKLSQYADDTTLFTKYENSIRSCMKTLSEFEWISGLKITGNKEKAKVVQLGVNRDNRMKLCTYLNLIWNHKFTAVGITYDVQNMKEIAD